VLTSRIILGKLIRKKIIT